MLADIEATDGGWVYYSEEVLTEDFADPDTDYPRGSVVVHRGASIAGYGVLTSHPLADEVHELRFGGAVHPAFRRHGLGSALMDWAETAAIPIHQALFPGWPLSLAAACISTNEPAIALYTAHGYRQVRWFHEMVRDLSEPIADASLPVGVQLVGYSPERMQDARLVRNEAFRDHWGSAEQTVETWAYFLEFAGFRPQFSFLAYSDDQPVGLIISHEYEQPVETLGVRDLYIAVVATRAAARNRGVASALLNRVLTEALAAGFTSASLGVDADSMTGAVGLYERAGFTLDHSTITYRKSLLGGG
jgi:mycothiol synthase